jgi:hypothetical protein
LAGLSSLVGGLGLIDILRPGLGPLGYATPALGSYVNGRAIIKTGTTTAAWQSENSGSDAAASTWTVAAANAAQRSAIATTLVSRASLVFGGAPSPAGPGAGADLSGAIISDLKGTLGAKIASAALIGAGTTDPLGLWNVAGVPVVAAGTNGGPPSQTILAAMEAQIAGQNADQGGPVAWVTNELVRKKSRGVEAFTGSGALWPTAGGLLGYESFVNISVPRAMTKGTSSGVCSGLALGRWDRCVIVDWLGGVEILIDPVTRKLQNMIEITARVFVDVLFPDVNSFVRCDDLTTT